MKKTDANFILNLILDFNLDSLEVSQGMQSAVNNFIDSYLKENPNTSTSSILWMYDRKSSNLSKSFREAIRTKLKGINDSLKGTNKKLIYEKEYIIKEACKELDMSSQNLNTLIKKYNLPIREVSLRKRFITQSTLEIIRKGKYKKK